MPCQRFHNSNLVQNQCRVNSFLVSTYTESILFILWTVVPGIGRVLRRVLGRAGGVAGLTFNLAAGSVVINADELVAETKRAGFT